MQLDEKNLRELITVILSVLREQGKIPEPFLSALPVERKRVFAVFHAPWDNRFYSFGDALKEKKNCRFFAVASPDLPERDVEKLRNLANWESFTVWNGAVQAPLEGSISVFPVIGRNTVVKTALCISDTFETEWIRAAMEQGGSVVLPRTGFERFTGREPGRYRQRILSYYRDLLEMNVELPVSFEKYVI